MANETLLQELISLLSDGKSQQKRAEVEMSVRKIFDLVDMASESDRPAIATAFEDLCDQPNDPEVVQRLVKLLSKYEVLH